jgi:hypothetical protein
MVASTPLWTSVSFLEALSWRYLSPSMSMARALWVKIQASVTRSGRRRPPSCGRRLGESALVVVLTSLALGAVDVGAAAPDGGGALRQRPRDPWWAPASWGVPVACMAWVTSLCC